MLLGLNPRAKGSWGYAAGVSDSNPAATALSGYFYGLKLTRDKTSMDSTVSCHFDLSIKANSNNQISLTLHRLHPISHVRTRDNVVTSTQKINCVNAMNVYLGYDIKADGRSGNFSIANDLKTYRLAF